MRYFSLGQETEVQEGQVPVKIKKSHDFSTYLMASGIGLFLLGNLGWWIAKGRRNQRKIERVGQTVAILGIIVRGAAEVVQFRSKTA